MADSRSFTLCREEMEMSKNQIMRLRKWGKDMEGMVEWM